MKNRLRLLPPCLLSLLGLRLLCPPATLAAPPPAPALRFAVIGDFGDIGPGEKAVASMVASWSASFIVTTGDNSYPLGDTSGYTRNLAPYKPWMDPDPAKNRFWPAVGNHDYVPGLGYAAFKKVFKALNNQVTYRLLRPPVEFFFLDSHWPVMGGQKNFAQYFKHQRNWLAQSLKTSKAPWKVVVFHHPPFTTSNHAPTPYMQWPFKAMGADLVLTGHNHVYERQSGGPFPHIVNGAGGHSHFYPCCKQKNPGPGKFFCLTDHYGAQLAEATPSVLKLSFISPEWPDKALDVCTLTKTAKGAVMSCVTPSPMPKDANADQCTGH